MRARHRHFNPAHAGATLVLDARFVDQANNSAMSAWNGRAGSSFNMAQATSANQPTLQHSAIGGQNAVRFDGSNDKMSCARVATTSNFTCMLILKGAGQNNVAVLAQHTGSPDINRTIFCASGETSPYQKARLFFNNGTSRNIISTTDTFDNSATLFCSESNGSGSSHVRVKNGEKEGTLTGQSWTPLNTDMTIGDVGPNGQQPFTGDISAVAFFTTQCSDAMRTRAHHAAAFSFKISCN